MTQYKYLRGSRDSHESIEFDITRRGQYITTCVVNVQLLLAGITAFPCGNGDDCKLTSQQQVEVLEFLQAERQKLRDRYPVKTLAGWRESGLPTFDDYCSPGDVVDDELVEEMINCVPPVLMLSFCTQAGEAVSHERDERGAYRPTYTTFHRFVGGHWQYDGACFYKENINRYTGKSSLERRLDAARKEAESNG